MRIKPKEEIGADPVCLRLPAISSSQARENTTGHYTRWKTRMEHNERNTKLRCG